MKTKTKYEYISTLTDFQAFEKPYIDRIYIMDMNNLVAEIYIDSDWKMCGTVIDPYSLPISPMKPVYGILKQDRCEQLIMYNMPPRCRKFMSEELKNTEIDYAQLMYKTRGISLLNYYWFAWSKEERAEDFHPRLNEEIMSERSSTTPILLADEDWLSTIVPERVEYYIDEPAIVKVDINKLKSEVHSDFIYE